MSSVIDNRLHLQFRALPFGISSAPWLFTKVFKQLAIILRKTCIAIHQYLDHWLNKSVVQGEVLSLCLLDRDSTLLCQQAGCLINLNKSELNLTQRFEFVGVHFDLQQGLVCPATEKMDRLMSKVSQFLNN